MTSTHPLPHAQYLQLLDLHGRAALDVLGALEPGASVPPNGAEALGYAREHLATLQVWAWLLAHPETDWRAYEGGPPPTAYGDVLASIDRQRDQLVRLLVDSGPDLELDYFGRPGTSHDVARLLAHEAISVACATNEARGTAAPPLHPDVASDCVDRALAHWSEPGADVVWHPAPAHLVAADTGRSWWVRFSEDREVGAIAPGSPGPVALTLADDSDSLLRWLEGYRGTSPQIEGDTATLRALRVALGHRVEPAPSRRWWRRG
ncbi:hypothetical protein [Nocardioides houyundeii]|uniref:hypothetical protein n=1 Tax=Nocardioides houyundeii TaxID=2045452 RepID=UPI000C762885|nr:hypothetical protein [Nocardioides houyundeii]